jgi:hypothetical protein
MEPSGRRGLSISEVSHKFEASDRAENYRGNPRMAKNGLSTVGGKSVAQTINLGN